MWLYLHRPYFPFSSPGSYGDEDFSIPFGDIIQALTNMIQGVTCIWSGWPRVAAQWQGAIFTEYSRCTFPHILIFPHLCMSKDPFMHYLMYIFLFPVKMLSNGWPISCLCKHGLTCSIIRFKKLQHVHALGEWEGSCPQIIPVATGNLESRDHGSDTGGGPRVRSRVCGNCLLAWLLCSLDSQIHFLSTYNLRGCREAKLSGHRVWGEHHLLRLQRGQGRVEYHAWGWRKHFRRWQDPTVDGRLWQSNLSIWQMSTAAWLFQVVLVRGPEASLPTWDTFLESLVAREVHSRRHRDIHTGGPRGPDTASLLDLTTGNGPCLL